MSIDYPLDSLGKAEPIVPPRHAVRWPNGRCSPYGKMVHFGSLITGIYFRSSCSSYALGPDCSGIVSRRHRGVICFRFWCYLGFPVANARQCSRYAASWLATRSTTLLQSQDGALSSFNWCRPSSSCHFFRVARSICLRVPCRRRLRGTAPQKQLRLGSVDPIQA